ncbi:MAG: tRNA methyltransferase [Deltaproteobacteria bacterium]|nr:tRNA methyltransferase [Deltaproteobacteria bacterium]
MAPTRKTEIKRFMRNLDRPKMELVLLLADVEDPVNVGSIFRIADACGAKELILTGISARPPHRLLSKVSRGKERRVAWRYEPDPVPVLEELGRQGYSRFAVEITADALPYDDDSVNYAGRTCLVVGHEDHGVTRRVLATCDHAIFLPMYGKGASLNVHVALGVAAFFALHAAAADKARR